MRRLLPVALLAAAVSAGATSPASAHDTVTPTDFKVLGPVVVDRTGPPDATIRVRYSCPEGQFANTFADVVVSFDGAPVQKRYSRTPAALFPCTGKTQVEVFTLFARAGNGPPSPIPADAKKADGVLSGFGVVVPVKVRVIG